jgi:glutamate dehydrogenase
VAAFDPRHIFIDPDPDTETSWAERARMFALPRSSWDDYDRSKLSTGGGVFARSLKSIPLTPQIKALLDLKTDSVSPTDLITAILKARVELLYLGGIGTYVKARTESHADAGDKASDAVRINGADLRCKVVGEGANLGLTQAGRIEYALVGGRINTDAIDNSAGVDSSDHEVNIKILTGMVERSGGLTRPDRNALLASMTDAVGAKVLVHNYDQTLALSLLEADAPRELDAHGRFMSELEAAGRLDRRVEGLPSAAVLTERAQAGKGLTRPELAVLLAYAKLDLSDAMVASRAPDDPVFEGVLQGYFPEPLKTYGAEMRRHRLRREIISTVLDNDIVNICGPTFPHRLREAAGCDTSGLVIGFEAARRVLGFNAIWSEVEALDGMVPAQGQLALFKALANALRAQTFWFARRAAKDGEGVQSLVRAYQTSFAALHDLMPGILSAFEQKTVARRVKTFTQDGAPPDLAGRIALLQPLTTAADLVDLASASSWPVENVARLYHQLGAAFELDQLRAAAGGLRAGDHYERLAVRRLIEDLLSEQTDLTRAVMTFAASHDAGATAEAARSAIASWSALRAAPARAVVRTIDDIEKAGGGWSFAKLTIANAGVRSLVAAA